MSHITYSLNLMNILCDDARGKYILGQKEIDWKDYIENMTKLCHSEGIE